LIAASVAGGRPGQPWRDARAGAIAASVTARLPRQPLRDARAAAIVTNVAATLRDRPSRNARTDHDAARDVVDAPPGRPASCARCAAVNSSAHDVTSGRARSSARRCRSVIPPHTPNSTRWSSACARHSVRTGQLRQKSRASRWRAPRTNNPSASAVRHRAATRQFRLGLLPLLGMPAPLVVARPTRRGDTHRRML